MENVLNTCGAAAPLTIPAILFRTVADALGTTEVVSDRSDAELAAVEAVGPSVMIRQIGVRLEREHYGWRVHVQDRADGSATLYVSVRIPSDVLDLAQPVSAWQESLIVLMHARGRTDLVHYAGAAHRDQFARELCVQYLEHLDASEADLRELVFAARATTTTPKLALPPEQQSVEGAMAFFAAIAADQGVLPRAAAGPEVESLRTEALAAGDYDQAAVCDLAINGAVDVDDYTSLTPRGARRLRAMTHEQAIAECQRVIADAAARAAAS